MIPTRSNPGGGVIDVFLNGVLGVVLWFLSFLEVLFQQEDQRVSPRARRYVESLKRNVGAFADYIQEQTIYF